MHNILVAAVQRQKIGVLGTVRRWLFAYNEVPTIAVAIDCWFRARLIRRALFYGPSSIAMQSLRNTFKYLGVLVDE